AQDARRSARPSHRGEHLCLSSTRYGRPPRRRADRPPLRRRGPAMSAPAGGSALSVAITRYLALKTALGRRYALERRVFETLTAFLQTLTDSPVDLTSETFTTWAQTLQRLTPTVRRNHLRFVRNLCLYRRRTEPACF